MVQGKVEEKFDIEAVGGLAKEAGKKGCSNGSSGSDDDGNGQCFDEANLEEVLWQSRYSDNRNNPPSRIIMIMIKVVKVIN